MHQSEQPSPYPAQPQPLGAYGGKFKFISDVGARQILTAVLFALWSVFVLWLVDGDPTNGETLRVWKAQQALEEQQQELSQRGGISSSFGAAAASGWCSEPVETRQLRRSMQRYAGFTFRERIDLCSSTAPTLLFDGVLPHSTQITGREPRRVQKQQSGGAAAGGESGEEGILNSETAFRTGASGMNWFGKTEQITSVMDSRRSDKDLVSCGLSSISKGKLTARTGKQQQQQQQKSQQNISWMVLPQFLDFFTRTANVSKSREEIYAAREDALLACSASETAMLGQLPPIGRLREASKLSDFTFLHHPMSGAEEQRLWEETRGAMRLAASLSQLREQDEVFDRVFEKSLARRGSPALHYAAMSAQYTAVHSCATPPATLASVVRVPMLEREQQVDNVRQEQEHASKNKKKSSVKQEQNEFASWRLWNGGPLVMAAVCRVAPFEVMLEVTPSASWVEVL